MKPTLFLRIASLMTLLHAVLHTIGGVFGKIEPGPIAIAVAAMKDNHFVTLGMPRTVWMFYRGMGLAVTIFLTFEAIVFWQLGSLARNGTGHLRPIYAAFLIAYIVLSINSHEYFFLGPVIVEILIALCFGLAIYTTKPIVAEVVR